MRFTFALPLSILAALVCLPPAAMSQSMRVKDLGVGKLLVAPRDCPDPHFAKTVILLVQLDPKGTLGLMVNHPTTVSISRALDQLKGANHRSDPIYLGGPVEVSNVFALLRTSSRPDDALRVVGDVYFVASRPVLEKTLAAGAGPGEFHAYLGYCGWGAGQLEKEMGLGAWYVFDGDSKLVFDSEPDSLWTRLIARIELKVERRPSEDVKRPPAAVEAWENASR